MEALTQEEINQAAKRFESRPVTDANGALIETIKGQAALLSAWVERILPRDQAVSTEAARLQALALTTLEQSVMWSVKAASRQQ